MLHTPFYDPEKTYEENFEKGPFGVFADGEVIKNVQNSTLHKYNFLGFKINSPFGIPAGPLINGKFVKAALDKGFDICVYKTVRSGKYPCHPFPNVLSVKIDGDLTEQSVERKLIADRNFKEPLSITNSFGVPSPDPEFWQKDLKEAAENTREGQIVVGSFQGTKRDGQNAEDYVDDFKTTARMLKDTGVKVIEVNLSCPNEGTNNLLCYDAERSAKVAKVIKYEIGEIPLIIKIAYFKDFEILKNFIEKIGDIVGGISAINTIPAEIVDQSGGQALPGEGRARSGVCGHTIKWAGLEMVRNLKKLREEFSYNFQIIGVGGVMNADDFFEYREAGADIVMSATGAMWNPYLAEEIKKSYHKHMGDVIKILKKVGAIITDSHFVGTSGRHTPIYINKDALYPHTKETSQVGKLFAEKFKNKNIEVVVAPAVAGIPLSQWGAYHLSNICQREVLSVFTEKTLEDDQILKRGYNAIVKNKRVLVVEDLSTTGGSVKKVINSVKGAGGKVVAACVMVNRDPKLVNSKSIGVPFSSLGVFKVPSYEEKNCPLCKKGTPINITVGHGKKFLETRKQ